MIGTSGLRRAVLRSNYSLPYRAQMGAVVALVRKLVDLAASQTELSIQPSGDDREHSRRSDQPAGSNPDSAPSRGRTLARRPIIARDRENSDGHPLSIRRFSIDR